MEDIFGRITAKEEVASLPPSKVANFWGNSYLGSDYVLLSGATSYQLECGTVRLSVDI